MKRKSDISTIFFDVGGVILDDFIDAKVVDLARKYGKKPPLLLELRKKHRPPADAGHISDRDFWRNLLREMRIEAAAEDYETDSYMRVIEEGMDLVAKLKSNGYRLAILSNDSKEIFAEKRMRYRFDELFDDVIVSNEHGFIKPYPEIYKIALSRMNVEPGRAVFIDDRQDNLTAAKALGMHTILHRNAERTEAALVKLGVVL